MIGYKIKIIIPKNNFIIFITYDNFIYLRINYISYMIESLIYSIFIFLLIESISHGKGLSSTLLTILF